MIGQVFVKGIPAAYNYLSNKVGSFFDNSAPNFALSAMTTPYGRVYPNYSMSPSTIPFSIGGFGSPGYETYAGRPGDAADIEVLRRVLNERQFQEHMLNLPEYNPNSRFDVEQFQRYMSDVRNRGPRVASRLDYDQPQMTDIDIFGSL